MLCNGIFTLTEPAPTCNLFASANGFDASSYGASDGTAQVFISGGQSNVTYIWTNGSTLTTSTGLSAGVANVTVSDDILPNCSVTATVNIGQPAATCDITANITTTATTVFGSSDGTATAIVSNEQGNIGYMWSTGGLTVSITGTAIRYL